MRVGLIGFGYWGPNLARNVGAHSKLELRLICDRDPQRCAFAKAHYPGVETTASAEDVFRDPHVDLVMVATPVETHYPLARQALEAGKHVFVEKPLTDRVETSLALVDLAHRQSRFLFVDHTFLFTGAVMKLKALLQTGELGDVFYFDSVRINLGLIQSDVDVIWDLGPHDLSILFHLFEELPDRVAAMGAAHAGGDQATSAYVHLDYTSGATAHLHLNWLAPVKVRRVLLGGSKKMVVYDDTEPSEKVKVYDKGVLIHEAQSRETQYRIQVDYRTGDMIAPKLLHREALATEMDHVVACIEGRERPISDGRLGLQVVAGLEAAGRALRNRESVPFYID